MSNYETRTPRLIVMEMEPLISALCNGSDAFDAIARANNDDMIDVEPTGILYIAEALGADIGRLTKMYEELLEATRDQPAYPTPPSPLTLVTE